MIGDDLSKCGKTNHRLLFKVGEIILMKNCWANSIGGCSSKISGEHIITKAVFKDDLLNISGVPWLSGETKKLPKQNLEANVLCTLHNSGLSSLDITAKNLAESLRELVIPRSQNLSLTLDGWLFERWCLKVLIGLLVSGWVEGGKVHIPQEFVEIAFGKSRFTNNAGLYFVINVTGVEPKTDFIQWRILLDSSTNTEVCGIAIIFRGLFIILFTREGNPEKLLRDMGKTDLFDFTNVKLRYRPTNLGYRIRDKETKTNSELNIFFTW